MNRFFCPKKVVMDLYEEIAGEELRAIGQSAVRELVQERELRIGQLVQRRRQRMQRKYFSAWLQSAKKQKRQREILTHFPSMPASLSLETQVLRSRV
jgi:hypothetical protein